MTSWILIVVGVLLALVGGLWALQGLGVVGGSVMTGDTAWAVIGPAVLLVGVAVVAIGLRLRRSPSR
ncbi:hypothetical protein ABT158_11850 [Nonomuraea sp. NPDC001636]|uniref:hypothetical protein n=1 Tax=Nonomuraea sp. NPDC001636 TaxID=3154391 RepID=UPI003317F8F5